MSDIMSEIVYSKNQYHIWFSEGDAHPYWISDDEGTEILACETLEEAKEELEHIIEGD